MTTEQEQPRPLEILLMGGFAVQVQGRALPRLRSRQGQWLLALLTLRHRVESEREWLAATLWPDSSLEQALYNLRRNLTDLRHALGPESARLLSPTPRTLRLDLSGAQADVLAFDAAIRQGATDTLEQAVTLYSGELLPGCREAWILPEREERTLAYLNALETLAAQAFSLQDYPAAEKYLRQALAADPLRESVLCTLMEVQAAHGDIAEITQTYRDFRLYLYRELHVEPAEETTTLYQRLTIRQNIPRAELADESKNSTLTAIRGHLPRPLTDLIGRELECEEIRSLLLSHRLITLLGPGGVGKTRLALAVGEKTAANYQDGAWFADLSALTDPALIAPTLIGLFPVPEQPELMPNDRLIMFLRSRRLLLILDNCEHLREETALLAGSLLRHCPNLNLLTTSREPLGLTGEAVWRVPSLGVPPLSSSVSTPSPVSLPSSVPSPAPVSAYRPRAEQGDKNALALLLDYPSIRLFAARAREARSDFRIGLSEAETIGQICRQLDGMPLAIELAAAQVRALSLPEIQARLEDRFRLLTGGSRDAQSRHQTLRAMMDWSFSLLHPSERALLCTLSVFVGGWTLEAAEVVGTDVEGRGEGGENPSVLADLIALIDKSLVLHEEQAGRSRYRMLETVRAYGLERLREDPVRKASAEQNHALFFAQFARIDTAGLSQEQSGEMPRLEPEQDNLRAAFLWCLRHAPEMARSMASGLWRFWVARGHYMEGRWQIEAVLQGLDQTLPQAETADILLGAVRLNMMQGEFSRAQSLLDQALAQYRALQDRQGEIAALEQQGALFCSQGDFLAAQPVLETLLTVARQTGNRWLQIQALSNLGYIAREQGDCNTARTLLEEAIALSRLEGNRLNEGQNLGSLGYVYAYQGEYDRAADLFMQARSIYRETDYQIGTAWALCSLGYVAMKQAQLTKAQAFLEEALQINHALGVVSREAWNLDLLGSVYRQQKNPRAAIETYEQALALCRQVGNRNLSATILFKLGELAAEAGDRSQTLIYYTEAVLLMQELGQRRELIEALGALTDLRASSGDFERAVKIHAAFETLSQTLQMTAPSAVQERMARQREFLEAKTDQAVFAALYAQGQLLSLEAVLEIALKPE